MIVEHDGRNIPTLPGRWDSSDIDTVFFDWSPMLGGASVTSSSWEVPEGWEVKMQYINQPISICGEKLTGNGALLSGAVDEGQYLIANTVTLSDGRKYQRSVYVYVEEI